MKNIKLAILMAFAVHAVNAQTAYRTVPDGNYYIVRHAEKDTGNNPALTNAGYLRAGDLYRTLKNKKIGKIYVSQYRRSQLTADSLRIYKKLDTVYYIADSTGGDLIRKLTVKKGIQHNVLIIGHSNTIPVILKALGITGLYLHEIPDNEYDNLFVVTVKGKKVSLKWLKYGKGAEPVGTPSTMKPLQ